MIGRVFINGKWAADISESVARRIRVGEFIRIESWIDAVPGSEPFVWLVEVKSIEHCQSGRWPATHFLCETDAQI